MISQERLDAIFDEVHGMVVRTGPAPDDSFPGLSELEQRLRTLLHDRQRHDVIELACYLRAAYRWNDQLPSWQLLLNETAALSLQRHGHDSSGDALYGLLPLSSRPLRNT